MIEDPKSSNDDLLRRISISSSVLLGLSAAYEAYVLFMQTTVVSLSRLALAFFVFLAVAGANYFLTTRVLNERLKGMLSGKVYAVSLCLLLPLLFLPLITFTPNYPINPLLREWTEIRVEYAVSANSRPLEFKATDVLLQEDEETLNAGAFSMVGKWNSDKEPFILNPGSSAALHWFGAASANMRLTVNAPPASGTLTIYWDQSRADLELTAREAKQFILVKKFTTPLGVCALLFIAGYILTAWLLILLAACLDGKNIFNGLFERAGKNRVLLVALVIALALGLSYVTVKLQLESLDGGAKTFIRTTQLDRHNAVLRGRAPNPWQYRVLSEYLAEGIVRGLQAVKVRNAIEDGFIALRYIQNIALFLLAFVLYYKLSKSKLITLIGVLLLAGSMMNAYYDNDLSFNTYFDVIFYLLTIILILNREYWWILLVMAAAALNRETSGLIPFLALAGLVDEQMPRHKKLLLFILPAAVFAAIFAALHLLYPNRPLYIPYGQQPGIPMLIYNVTRAFTWDQLYHTLGLAPVIGVLFIFSWPRLWQRFLIIVIPVWFAIHFVLSVADETRLFLVPMAVIFIPGVLFGLNYLKNYDKTLGQEVKEDNP